MRLKGVIIEIGDIKKTLRSTVRNFVLKCDIETRTQGIFSNEYLVTLTAERVYDLDRYQVGDEVEIDFNLGASKYIDRESGTVTRYNLMLCKHMTRTSLRETPYNPMGFTRNDTKTGLV